MKKKNCILYLVRTSKQDVDLLNRSLDLVYNNVLPYLKQEVDIILFHEKDFDESYKNMILKNNKIKIIFQEIIFEIPKYSKKILDQIPEFFPHPTHGPGKEYAHTLPTPHKGFTLGYRHMCRFFSGDLFNQQILNNYENYMRLDNDSFILSPIYYDIFEWFEKVNAIYSYIEPAVQIDHPKVVEGLNKTIKNWIETNNIHTKTNINTIPEGKMYYTNFEIANINWFRNSMYKVFYDYIDSIGQIYISRWGDAPIRFLGTSLFLSKENIKPVYGFTYQHGAIYKM